MWSLERLGFAVKLYQDPSSLADKLRRIYLDNDCDFIRVDADVIVNKNVLALATTKTNAWWLQARTFDWYQQDLTHGGVQLIRSAALPDLKRNIDRHMNKERPESAMYRLEEFHKPRRCLTAEIVCGIHGWGQNDLERIKDVKARRGQIDNYDFELVEAMDDFIVHHNN